MDAALYDRLERDDIVQIRLAATQRCDRTHQISSATKRNISRRMVKQCGPSRMAAHFEPWRLHALKLSMSLIGEAPSSPCCAMPGTGLAQVRAEILAQVFVVVSAGSLNQPQDFARAGRNAPAMHLPHLLIGRGDDVFAQRFEQKGQFRTGLPARHSSLQL